MENRPADPEMMLTTIWAALGGGVLLFAAVAFLAVGPLGPRGETHYWRLGWVGVALLAVVTIGYVRGRLAPGAPADRRRTTAILVWAVAEGQAMLGLVAYLVTADPVPAVAGLALFLYLFIRHRPATFLGSRPGG